MYKLPKIQGGYFGKKVQKVVKKMGQQDTRAGCKISLVAKFSQPCKIFSVPISSILCSNFSLTYDLQL